MVIFASFICLSAAFDGAGLLAGTSQVSFCLGQQSAAIFLNKKRACPGGFAKEMLGKWRDSIYNMMKYMVALI
ncbi:hypothetical protein VV869_00740 [Photobacterium sp. MCCC 1A19761]|uniref:hypothetical protein n=1 Tax=Photobacterium sp. MCCC 1A19761 TaxID=3115000 RepID=UPI00307DA552